MLLTSQTKELLHTHQEHLGATPLPLMLHVNKIADTIVSPLELTKI
jgi:hypothetical protein